MSRVAERILLGQIQKTNGDAGLSLVRRSSDTRWGMFWTGVLVGFAAAGAIAVALATL